MKKIFFFIVTSMMFAVSCASVVKSDEPLSVAIPDKQEFILTNMYKDMKITIGFDGGRVFGFSGVNRYMGAYEIKDGKIKFGNMGATMMAGPEENMNAESQYLKLLNEAGKFSFDGTILKIGKLEFKAK